MNKFCAIPLLLTCLTANSAYSQNVATSTDGLESARAESLGVSSKPLQDMEAAIRKGDFKKIGSVVVARHGKVVYKGYFDGDARSLRDTRSATKSITDILVGIAI